MENDIKIGESKVYYTHNNHSVYVPRSVRMALQLGDNSTIEWVAKDGKIFVQKKGILKW